MKFINRIIPWIAALILFLILEKLLQAPKQVYWLTLVSFLVIILGVWQLINRRIKDEKFWYLIITPLFLFAGGLFFLSFLEGRFFKQFFVVVLSVLIWVFLKVVFLKFHFRARYQAYSLENISTHFNLIAVFLIASSFFNLTIFLGVPAWLLVIIFATINVLLIYQLVRLSDVTLSIGWPYVVVITLIATEIFWAVSFLPTSVYINGLIVTIVYYLVTGLARNRLLGVWQKQVIKRYLLISLISLAAILLSAKWF